MADDVRDIELEPILNGDDVNDLVEVVSIGRDSDDQKPNIHEEQTNSSEDDLDDDDDDDTSNGDGVSSPLHLASQVLDAESVKLLLDEGDRVNALDERGLTPLDVAGEKLPADHASPLESFLQVINALIANGGTPTTKRNAQYCETPIHVAVNMNSIKAVHTLLNAGYDEPIANGRGNTALHDAAFQRFEEPLKVLVSVYKTSAINLQNKRGETPLHIAVQSQFLEGVRTLIKNGADVKVQTGRRKTVLHIAATKNHIKIMKHLLEHEDCKHIINDQDAGGNSPLFLAVLSKQYKCTLLLLKEADVDLRLVDDEERTVLQCATESRQPKMIEALFKHDSRSVLSMIKDHAAKDDLTALHIAAYKGDCKCTEILVGNSCDLRKKATFEDRDVTALHLATIRGHDEVVRVILNSDPTLVNDPDSSGMMPIHWACIHCHSKVIKTIVDAGCDLSAKCAHPDDGTVTTAMDLFINRVPGSVDLVENILDDSICVKNKSIGIDYRILLPKKMKEKTIASKQLKVINALVETGDMVNQGSLFVHPVIESFLCLQWERVVHFYYLLIFAYLLFVIPFSIKVVFLFYYKDRTSQDAMMIVLRVLIVLSSLVYIPHQFLYMYLKTRNSRYFMHWEFSTAVFSFILKSTLRFFIIGFMFVVFLLVVIDPENLLTRELATGAIFLFSIEFMLLISRVPTYGLYMLMFFKVTSNFFTVLLSFMFLILGFVIIFLVEFRGNPPFTSTSEAFLKTVVMMTNELEYKDMFEDFQGSEIATVFSKLVFLLFLLLVGIVTMNILLAKAILDVEKVDRLRKQAEFLSTYEQLLVLFPVTIQEVGPKQRVYFDKAQPFPRKLMNSILDKAYKVKKDKLFDETSPKQQECKHDENHVKLNKLLSKFEQKLNVLSNKIEHLSKKINSNEHKDKTHNNGENRVFERQKR